MIKTKSVQEPVEESDGERILITRFWPEGFTKRGLALSTWYSNLTPSRELLLAWKSESISWEAYTKRYSEEMAEQGKDVRELAKKASEETITLICLKPKDDPHCHRHMLKKLIEDRIERAQ